MEKITLKVAYPLIISGLFVIVAFIALNYQNLNTSFYVVMLLLTIYIFLFGFATGQNFARPVKRLLQKADDLSRGNLKSRFYSDSKDKDEISELGNIFNKMAEQIEETKTTAATLEKAVDIKVKARTQSLEETINALEQKVKNRTMELQRIVEQSEKMNAEEKMRNLETENLRKELDREGYIASKKPEKVEPVPDFSQGNTQEAPEEQPKAKKQKKTPQEELHI